MERLQFIHAADLHLGATVPAAEAPGIIKDQVQNSIYTAVDNMVKDAIERQVDFIILAGDLFDQENRSIKSQLFLKRKLELLCPYDIPVYVIFGNHDPVQRKYAPAGWPENVHIFSVEPEVKAYYKNEQVAAFLYGCSYGEREVFENVAKKYKKMEGDPYHIGILHGQEISGNGDHSPYAPFTLRDLQDKEMDYWALGHVHKRQYLSERIGYSGNIQGRHRKEEGKKGYSVVHLEREEIEVEFVPASPIIFDQITLSITGHQTISSLIQQFMQLMEDKKNDNTAGALLEVRLIGSGPLSEFLAQDSDKEEWREVLNQAGALENPFFYIYQVTNRTQLKNENSFQTEHSFLADVGKAAEDYLTNSEPMEKEWAPLINHPSVRKFFHLTKADEKQIIEEAKHLVYQLWERGESR